MNCSTYFGWFLHPSPSPYKALQPVYVSGLPNHFLPTVSILCYFLLLLLLPLLLLLLLTKHYNLFMFLACSTTFFQLSLFYATFFFFSFFFFFLSFFFFSLQSTTTCLCFWLAQPLSSNCLYSVLLSSSSSSSSTSSSSSSSSFSSSSTSYKALQPIYGSGLLNHFLPTISILCYFLPIAYAYALYAFQNVIFPTCFRSSNSSFRRGFPSLNLLHNTPIIRSTNNCIYSMWNWSTVVATCRYRGAVETAVHGSDR